MKLRIADNGIVNDSVVDGPGIRLSVFAQGCIHGCAGCHNPHTHDPAGGLWVDTEEILAIIRKNPLLDGITLTGGEPFLQPAPMALLAAEVQNMGLDVIAYTGFQWEDLLKNSAAIPFITHCDFIIDGPFEADKKSLGLKFRGSANQRVIDVKKTMDQNKVMEADL